MTVDVAKLRKIVTDHAEQTAAWRKWADEAPDDVGRSGLAEVFEESADLWRQVSLLIHVYEAARAMWLKNSKYTEMAKRREGEPDDVYRKRQEAGLVEIAMDSDLVVHAVGLAEWEPGPSEEELSALIMEAIRTPGVRLSNREEIETWLASIPREEEHG